MSDKLPTLGVKGTCVLSVLVSPSLIWCWILWTGQTSISGYGHAHSHPSGLQTWCFSLSLPDVFLSLWKLFPPSLELGFVISMPHTGILMFKGRLGAAW